MAACETMHGAWTTTNFAPSHFQKKKKLEKKEQMDWNWPIIDLPTSVKVTLIQLRFICFCFGCFFSLFYNGLSGRSTNSTSSSTTSAENCKRHFHVFQYDWLVFFLIFFFLKLSFSFSSLVFDKFNVAKNAGHCYCFVASNPLSAKSPNMRTNSPNYRRRPLSSTSATSWNRSKRRNSPWRKKTRRWASFRSIKFIRFITKSWRISYRKLIVNNTQQPIFLKPVLYCPFFFGAE